MLGLGGGGGGYQSEIKVLSNKYKEAGENNQQ